VAPRPQLRIAASRIPQPTAHAATGNTLLVADVVARRDAMRSSYTNELSLSRIDIELPAESRVADVKFLCRVKSWTRYLPKNLQGIVGVAVRDHPVRTNRHEPFATPTHSVGGLRSGARADHVDEPIRAPVFASAGVRVQIEGAARVTRRRLRIPATAIVVAEAATG